MYHKSSSSQSSTPQSGKKLIIETVQVHSTHATANDSDRTVENVKTSKDRKNQKEKRRKPKVSTKSTTDDSVYSTTTDGNNFFADSHRSNETIISNNEDESSDHNKEETGESQSTPPSTARRRQRRKSVKNRRPQAADSKASSSYDKKRHHSRRRSDDEVTRKRYFYEKLIGIFIHSTSDLVFKKSIKSPYVRVSIWNSESGGFLKKSDPKRSVVGENESESIDYIQPVISKAGNFLNTGSQAVEWEEMILWNEDVSHIDKEETILFFELIEVVSVMSKKFKRPINSDGWLKIAWAFLLIHPDRKHSNLDKRLRLQLYKYDKSKNITVFEQYGLPNRRKYPATIDITVKGITPIKKIESPLNDHSKKFPRITTKTKNLVSIINHWDKMPGRAFKCPTDVMMRKVEQPNGSSFCKFDKTGSYLAYTRFTLEKCCEICVIQIPSLELKWILKAHTSIIYDLDWLDPQTILSASADKSAIVWKLEDDHRHDYDILPHPSFVYAARFLEMDSIICVVTGGRDEVLRFWKCGRRELELHQQVTVECGYVTSIVCDERDRSVYSATSNGDMLEHRVNIKKRRIIVAPTRHFKHDDGIGSLTLHPRGHKLISVTKNTISLIDKESFVIVRSITVDSPNMEKVSVSPCGTFLFISSPKATIKIFNLNSNKFEERVYTTIYLSGKDFISSIDVHSKDSYLCATIYGPNGGGVMVLKGDRHELAGPNDGEYDNEEALPHNFAEIIQRVDDVFLGNMSEKLEKLNIQFEEDVEDVEEHEIDEVEAEENMSVENDEEELSGRSSNISNRTFDVEKLMSGDSSDDIDNHTYSVKSKSGGNLTFVMEKEKDGSGSSTSISETLD